MIRVLLPFHLRTLAHVGSEVALEIADLKPGAVTQRSVLGALESRAIPCCAAPSATTTPNSAALRPIPALLFLEGACEEDLSHNPPDARLPDAVASGEEPFIIIGAIAGG